MPTNARSLWASGKTSSQLNERLSRIQARAEAMDKAWNEERGALFPEKPEPVWRWAQQADGSWRHEEQSH